MQLNHLELNTGDGILKHGKTRIIIVLSFLIILLFNSCHARREKIINLIEHDYSKIQSIDDYPELSNEFKMQGIKHAPKSWYYPIRYSFRGEQERLIVDFVPKYETDSILPNTLYLRIMKSGKPVVSEEIINDYLCILNNSYGDCYYDILQIRQEIRTQSGKIVREAYSKNLPYWKSGKKRIYFYQYETGEPPCFDKYPTFIVTTNE